MFGVEKSYLSFGFPLGLKILKGNQWKEDGYIYIYTLGNYKKTSTNTGHENMLKQKLKRDCGRARNAQGSPKAGARAIFVPKNLAQTPMCMYMYVYVYVYVYLESIYIYDIYIYMCVCVVCIYIYICDIYMYTHITCLLLDSQYGMHDNTTYAMF